MDTAAVIQALKTPRAVLACLAMILLSTNAWSQDYLSPPIVETQPLVPYVQVSGSASSLPSDPPAQDLPTLGNPLRRPKR